MALKPLAGTENKRPSIITRDAPVGLITQEIPKVLGAVSQKLWAKAKIYFLKYI